MGKTLAQPKALDESRPLLHVNPAGEVHVIPFTPGCSVREILDSTDWRVRSACGGIGACGQCLVRIEKGAGNEPSTTEQNTLSSDQIRQGVRLACQLKPLDDLWISIENPAPKSNWKGLSLDTYTPASPKSTGNVLSHSRPYGVAVDLGTTQIRLSLFDITKGRWMCGRIGLNPQAGFGADVLTRLVRALESEERAREMRMLARDAIGEILQDITARESCNLQEIGQMAIVGNTPMLSLLTGKNYDLVLQPDYWMREVDCIPEETRNLSLAWGLVPEARIEIVKPLAGFVGSDLLAGVHATELIKGPAGSLLIDFGTNSEIALWDGAQLWITSAAGGPAFEGCGISCGMPADLGAIYRAEWDDLSSQFYFQVLGGGEAKGLCGSGVLDIIAGLVKNGTLNSNGRFMVEIGTDGYPLGESSQGITLKKRDIDVFQRAKAAIGAGTKCLLAQAGLHPDDLQRICVCGAFGQFLNITNAQAIGLLPKISPDKVKLCGNTALTGCEELLFSPDQTGTLDDLRNRAKMINMSTLPEFENLFIQNLYLQPMQIEGDKGKTPP